MQFNLNKSFVTISEPSERTSQVAEMFGLGSDRKREFAVLENFNVDIKPGDIIFITGDSGGGKSTLLRMLSERMSTSGIFGRVSDINQIKISEDEVLIENCGQTFEETLRNLCISGLNDAFLLIRKFRELSDGQKYRYKIAKMLSDIEARTWLADEFASSLDRTTARVISFCLQKAARRLRKTLVVAAAQDDIEADLRPTISIRKCFGSECVANYNHFVGVGECSLAREVSIREGTRQDYERLESFHYRAKLPDVTRWIYILLHGKEVIGAICYGNPPLRSAGRASYFGYSPSPEEINQNFTIISRVVVRPKYRSIGFGAKIVRETLPLPGKKFVESIAVMSRFNPFFEKAGMHRVTAANSSSFEHEVIVREIEQVFGIKVGEFEKVLSLSREQFKQLCEFLGNRLTQFVLGNIYGHEHRVEREKVAADLIANPSLAISALNHLNNLSQEKAYHVWKNPGVD